MSECTVNDFSSRVCELGTLGCIVRHDEVIPMMKLRITEPEAINAELVETLRQVMLTQESYADDEEVLAEIYLMVEQAQTKLGEK